MTYPFLRRVAFSLATGAALALATVSPSQAAAKIQHLTSPGGIEMQENGSALILMHTRGQQQPIIVSTPGSLRARFVDQDTGQVTINNVYSD